ncbi:XrtA/PEP-CTERM system TPR-repeat protein PrsT [Roseateles saccharophilus]|uniref:Putative PEP-CTERM system TPR-repeat lipoprotein n=1 Tax=Roseateles saccharophilus TaxID=304 RepID=A0A4R3UHB0_ROSSA|nr:XrtA/PEP-CTERM system TPR-repeat protein PrsT [Roseateles saccharophilus]MDG0834920.1 PEP-CTERM system TPR-repeat protein PrsT [Roseateles saccharophilus]TCU88334.1 putative PEP-CTERM system TPR-repeat lipoprotein [Roseateles saccharophilus]
MPSPQKGRHRRAQGAATLLAAALLLGGCFGSSADQYLKSGKAKLAASDLRGASIEFRNALQKDASLAEARFLLGSALLRQGDAQGGFAELERAQRLGYDANQVVPLMARALSQQGQHGAVLMRFGETALTDPPAIAALQLSLARAHLGLGQAGEAEAAVKRALDAAPGLPEALQLQARVVALGGDVPAAIAQVEALIAGHPQADSNWLTLGDLQLAAGHADAARQSYAQAIKLNPSAAQGYASLLPLQLSAGDLQGATATLAALEKADARSMLARYYKAWIKLEQGELPAAQELGENLLKQSPDNADLLYLVGAIEARRNSLDRAVDLLAKAVAAAPEPLRPRMLLAQTLLRRGDVDQCLQALQPLLKREPAPAEALVLAAAATARSGEGGKAEQLLERAVASDPLNVQARVGLAVARVGRGEVDEGLKQLREVARSTPELEPDATLIDLLMRQRRYDAALEAIHALEAKPEGRLVAEMLRGRLELARNNVAQAREAFDAVLQADGANMQATAALAGLDIVDKHPEAAQARFQKLLEKNPANGAARSALLKLEIDRGASSEQLFAMARQAVKLVPGSRELRLDLIRLLLSKPDAREAAQVAQESINLLGEDAELLAALGQAQLLGGDANLASKSFARLLALKPGLPQSHLWLAQAYSRAGDAARALQVLRHGIELLPGEPGLYRGEALLLIANGQPTQALEAARQLQAHDKTGWQGLLLEGDVFAQQERYDEAVRAYTAALGKNPASALAVRLHQTLERADKVDAAAAFERKRLADDPRDWRFISHLGESALRARRFDVAEARFRQALALQPQNPALLNNLAWVMSRQGRAAAALDFADRAVKLAPNQPDLWDTLAEVRAASMQYDAAVQAQQQALALAPQNHLHRLHLATYLLQAGKKEQAKAELTRLAQLGGRFDRQAEVQRMLATL